LKESLFVTDDNVDGQRRTEGGGY